MDNLNDSMSLERRNRKREIDRQSATRKRLRAKGIDVPLLNPVRPRGLVDCSRWVHIDGTMARIELANGKGFAVVDSIDAPLASRYLWCLQKGRRGVSYAASREHGTRKKLYLHHLIHGQPAPGVLVDHRDRDGLNCRRENLRSATYAQNSVNSVFGNGRYKGVSLVGKRRWHTTVANIHIGTFASPEEAARAYDRELVRLYGDFARTNFPVEGSQ